MLYSIAVLLLKRAALYLNGIHGIDMPCKINTRIAKEDTPPVFFVSN